MNENKMDIDVTKVIDKLSMEIAGLIRDKAILSQMNEEQANLINGLQEEINHLKSKEKEESETEQV